MFPLYFTGLGNRKNNQDFYLSVATGDDLLIGVADGVGGNRGGDIASKLAVRTFTKNFLQLIRSSAVKEALEASFHIAHEAIIEQSEQKIEYSSMATTLSVAYILKNKIHVAHSGDSRVYLLRGNGIKQLTEDQTEVNMFLKEGLISAKDAETYHRKNIIVNALGIKSDFDVQIEEFGLEDLDRIVLLTDGFYESVSKSEFRNLSVEEKEFSNFLFNTIQLCKTRKPNDNYTIVGVEYSTD